MAPCFPAEMNGGVSGNADASATAPPSSTNKGTTEDFSKLSLTANGGSPDDHPPEAEKDPRIIARKYQIDLCKKALEENVIVCLGTGCGKTHIAVLLIYEMGHLIRKPQKDVCIFLAPTVALVHQQAKVIEESLDFKVGIYCGKVNRPMSHREWEKEMEDHEILVMTPQVLLHYLNHSFIKIELIALLIFDECHYAQPANDHPYSEIMKVYYKSEMFKLPRIFGMTASPILGRGASIGGLESVLRAKVYSVEDDKELEQFVNNPKLSVYYYGPAVNSASTRKLCLELETLRNKFVSSLSQNNGDPDALQRAKKLLQKLHGNILFCQEYIGLWGALQASCIFLKGEEYELDKFTEAARNHSDYSLCGQFLTQAKSIYADACREDCSDLSRVEVMKEPFFSCKLIRLIGILRNFRLQPNQKCIVFVNRIVTARSLSYILQNLTCLSSWKCDFILGVHSVKGRTRKKTNDILEKFRSGELNLLIATKVGEEGLDIQTCCLVIRFDLPETISSFIQSRGRARMPQSEYAFLVDSCCEREKNLIRHFVKDESKMNDEISSRESQMFLADFNEITYRVDLTGATISSASSVSLLYRYCSKLCHDEYFNPKPRFFKFDDKEGMVCHIILPSNAPFREIVSAPHDTFEEAKKEACLKACKALHEVGALTDHLLPEHYHDSDEIDDLSDSESSDDEDSRKELHEMLIPAALREKWTESDSSVSLCVYYFKFRPNPPDRLYKEFGLFVKATLPKEAGTMKLDLHLECGRSVLTELIPSGIVIFDKENLVEAVKFQRMFLKIILDRSELISEFVTLEDKVSRDAYASTAYLLLPVLFDEDNKISVDWKVIRRCLSSPIFMAPRYGEDLEVSQMKKQLHLANGMQSREDVLNSLVYVPCKKIFVFVSDIILDKDGYSRYKDSTSHVQHYLERFNISLKCPDQPLLKAKQLFCMGNLLRKRGHSEVREKEEHFMELPPEICQLKVVGFSKDIGSSLSVLPSFMHRLESFLVAMELKNKLSASFPEGAEITIPHVLEALTTERCHEGFSLERLEVLGDVFLKFAVGRHLFLLHDSLDEGQLTRKRSKVVNNSNLLNLATRKKLQVYIRDQSFEPQEFFPVGRLCPRICNKETEKKLHSVHERSTRDDHGDVRCSKCHHWLYKKTIADVLEALVGAFLVDSGFKAATAFLRWIGVVIECNQPKFSKICSSSSTVLSLAVRENFDVPTIESILGYEFTHKGLLTHAFIHPSYNNQSGGCYQRLEFLGDAVLDYLITSYLYSAYPKLKPGQLTDLRSASVNNTSFAAVAIRHSIHKFLLSESTGLSKSIEKYACFIQTAEKEESGEPPCPKALGDLVESCMGAVLLDSGFNLECVWNTMLSLLDPATGLSKLAINPIRDLRELCQAHNLDLKFSASKKNGVYSVQGKVDLGDKLVENSADNISKRSARAMASKLLYLQLKDQGYRTKTKSLEEVLKQTEKMPARLVGYNETPWTVSAESIDLMPQEVGENDFSIKLHALNEDIENNLSVCPMLMGRRAAEGTKNVVCNGDSRGSGGLPKTYKSRLYEVCAANSWKPPAFECYRETGEGHLKQYGYKVVVEIIDINQVVEAYGDIQGRKKDAEHSAAEGVLWYLEKEGRLNK